MKKVLAGAAVVAIGGLLALVLIDGGSKQEQLTATERADARRVALGSADVKRILGGVQYSVKSGDRLGHECASQPPDRVYWVPLTVKDLRTVYVFVDLSQSQAAAIVPSESKGLGDWKVPARTDNTCS